MSLTWRDLRTTLIVFAAAIGYAVWVSGAALQGLSTTVVAVGAFALGMAGCMSNDKEQLAAVFGTGAQRRVPLAYAVVASTIGAAAFVAGVIAMIWANEAMLATLVVSTVVLWALATVRHAITRPARAPGEVPESTATAAVPAGRR
ncbi:MAG: hypothetical protein ICV70_06385 [Jiangellaceae bacterium]|nr:hypothetical protein [Jiangellaceae bacterium]